MRILLNGEARDLEGATLADALEAFGYKDAIVATALNGRFVPAPLRARTALNDNDAIEVLAPMQGG